MTDTNLKPSVRSGQPTGDGELITRTGRSGASAPGDSVKSIWLTGVAVTLCVFQLFLLPLWLLPIDAAWGWVLVPIVLTTTPFWSLIHEAIHGTLLTSRPWNDRWGRVMAVLYGAPFALLKAGHLLHHRYSRTRRERSEIYDADETNWAKVAPGYYFRLVCGLYLSEIASVLLAVLPASVLRRIARRIDSPDTLAGTVLERIAAPRSLSRFRADAAAIVAI